MMVDRYTPLYQIEEGEARPSREMSQHHIQQILAQYEKLAAFSEKSRAQKSFLHQAYQMNEALGRGTRLVWQDLPGGTRKALLRSIVVWYEQQHTSWFSHRYAYDILCHNWCRNDDHSLQTDLFPFLPSQPLCSETAYCLTSDPTWRILLNQVNLGGHLHFWDQKSSLHEDVPCDHCDMTYAQYLSTQHSPGRWPQWYIEQARDIDYPEKEIPLKRIYDQPPDEGGILRLVLKVNDPSLVWGQQEMEEMIKQALEYRMPEDRWEPCYWIAEKRLNPRDASHLYYTLIWRHAVSWTTSAYQPCYATLEALLDDWKIGLVQQSVPWPYFYAKGNPG